MRKALLPVFVIVSCCMLFFGCIKSDPIVTTTNPSMTATVTGGYKFIASTVVPATIDSQAFDTTQTLVITANSSDKAWPTDKIILSIASYHNTVGTWSMVQGQGAAYWIHGGVVDPAVGGVVAINKVTTNTLEGYFKFTTFNGVILSDGLFVVNIPPGH